MLNQLFHDRGLRSSVPAWNTLFAVGSAHPKPVFRLYLFGERLDPPGFVEHAARGPLRDHQARDAAKRIVAARIAGRNLLGRLGY